ncbi:MAG TPA: hypothetical protein VGK66_03725 [Solirubrobacterales bacterium]|nr:hypothetical protein [Solirubrobacterales bacterium]
MIVAAVIAGVGVTYSILHSLSIHEIVIYVLLPAAVFGVMAGLVMFSRALETLFLHLAEKNAELRQDLDATTARLGEAEDRLGRQISQIAYGEVIKEAEEEGWTVTTEPRGGLKFSHPVWGTAGGGSDDLDPDRLRLLLSIGKQVRSARKSS